MATKIMYITGCQMGEKKPTIAPGTILLDKRYAGVEDGGGLEVFACNHMPKGPTHPSRVIGRERPAEAPIVALCNPCFNKFEKGAADLVDKASGRPLEATSECVRTPPL
jgi:hypothetical protein